MWFYNILSRASYHCIIQFVITPQTVVTWYQLWHLVYCGTFQSAILKAIKALFLQVLWSFQVNTFNKPKPPLQCFLEFSILSLGIAMQRPEFLLLNKIARTVQGNFLSSREQMLAEKHKVVSSHRLHWGRFICTVWQEEEWGLAFLMMVLYLEVPIQIHADWRFYSLLITRWIEKKWYSQAISARYVLKSNEVVGRMKLQRRDAKVHQHLGRGEGKEGRSMLLPILNSTCLVLLQTDTPEDKE